MKKEKPIILVGLGLIGGSIAKALKKNTNHPILAFDKNPNVIKLALDCGAIDAEATKSDLCQAEVIYLCTYPQAAVEFIRENGALISSSCVVTDVCGIKNAICPQMTALAKQYGFSFIGGHPMAGKEFCGFENSDAEIFTGSSYILVPCSADADAVHKIKKLALKMGFSNIVETTPKHHDEMIAFTSQLPHVLACAYVMSPLCRRHQGFSAGSYRDVSRVANINETMWSELFLENQEALLSETQNLIVNLQKFESAIRHNNHAELLQLLKQSRILKEEADSSHLLGKDEL